MEKFLDITLKILIGIVVSLLAAVAIFLISLMVIIVINITTSRTKYEYYTLDGEKGTTYYCEAKEKVQCEIDGNMIEVAQFSEAE